MSLRRSSILADRLWVAFLGLEAAGALLHFALPLGSIPQGLVFEAVNALGAVAIAVGVVVHRPPRRAHWWLLVAALGLWAVGDAVWNVLDWVLDSHPYPSVADWIYLAGYVVMLLSMLMLIRSRGRATTSDLLDAAILACGSALLLWFVLIEPSGQDATAPMISRVVSVAYPVMDLLLLLALFQLFLRAGARGPSFRLFTLGACVLLTVDAIYGLQSLDGSYVTGSWVDGGWMAANALWGAAALHPSMRSLNAGADAPRPQLTWWRLGVLGAVTVVPTILVATIGRHENELDQGLLAGFAVAVIVLAFVRMSLLFHEHGAAVAALRDASARQTSHERFQTAGRAIECAIYEWTLEGDIVQWTEGLTTAFGYSLDEVEPHTDWWFERVHPDDRPNLEPILGQVSSGTEVFHTEYRFRRRDGVYRHVLDRWVARYDADGRPVQYIGGMVDVTERRELEAQLLHAQKMDALGRLAGGVAHDFNNLLMGIGGYAELARSYSAAEPKLDRMLAEISRATDRASGLTRQLLAFSSRQVLQTRVVELNGVVHEVEGLLRRLLPADVQLVVELTPEPTGVRGDPTQLEQVLVNLAVNARDAMVGGGRLTLTTRADQDNVVLDVADTGCGMEPETAARVFEPFFTMKERGKGTGLGLATVYGIVTQSGGTVELETAPGEGTRFEISLPRVASAQPRDDAQDPSAVHGGSEQILVVEDDDLVRSSVTAMLEGQGYTVVAAALPEEALRVWREHRGAFDLVLTDLVMPQMDGTALVERLATAPRVLYMSGYADVEHLDPGLPEGAELLVKPFTRDTLLRRLRAALDEREPVAPAA